MIGPSMTSKRSLLLGTIAFLAFLVAVAWIQGAPTP
jgi:hypothetical protein